MRTRFGFRLAIASLFLAVGLVGCLDDASIEPPADDTAQLTTVADGDLDLDFSRVAPSTHGKVETCSRRVVSSLYCGIH